MAQAKGASKDNNFLRQFRDKHTRELKQFTAGQFMEVWSHFDQDHNGYIEGQELDGFLREFVSSINSADVGPEVVSDTALLELKTCFLEAYDENNDGKIEIVEMAQLLPTDENFLLFFRKNNPLDSSIDFMKIWKEYDKDNSGFIEADELKAFLKHLLKQSKRGVDFDDETLIEYADTILHIFDSNRDGKLQLSEMAKLLPVKENFLCRSIFKGASCLTKEDIQRVFNLYDRDRNGSIENEELSGFIKDLMELVKTDYDTQDLKEFRSIIMQGCDVDSDGRINKGELTMVLMALSKKD